MTSIETSSADFWWNIYFNDVNVFSSNESKSPNVAEKSITFVEFLKFFFFIYQFECVWVFFLIHGGFFCFAIRGWTLTYSATEGRVRRKSMSSADTNWRNLQSLLYCVLSLIVRSDWPVRHSPWFYVPRRKQYWLAKEFQIQ